MRLRASLFRGIAFCRLSDAGEELRFSITDPFKVLLEML